MLFVMLAPDRLIDECDGLIDECAYHPSCPKVAVNS